MRSAETERDFTKNYLGPALTKAGFGKDKVHIMPFDHGGNSVLGNVSGDIVSYVDYIWKDQDAAKFLAGNISLSVY